MPPSKEKELEAQFVGFKLGEREFAVDIRRIIEIIYFCPITPMPESPEFVEGVVDLRGKIIPVVNLSKILNITGPEKSRPNHILIIRIQKRRVGVIVDNVQEVLSFSLDKVQSPQAFLGGKPSPNLKGVYRKEERLIFVLSMENLLSGDETNHLYL